MKKRKKVKIKYVVLYTASIHVVMSWQIGLLLLKVAFLILIFKAINRLEHQITKAHANHSQKAFSRDHGWAMWFSTFFINDIF